MFDRVYAIIILIKIILKKGAMANFSNQSPVSTSRMMTIMILAIVLTALIVGSVVYVWQKQVREREIANVQSALAVRQVDANIATQVNTNENTNTTVTKANPADETTIEPVSDLGVTWLTAPEALGDFGYVIDPQQYGIKASYFKIADLANGGELIFVDIPSFEMAGLRLRFRKNSDNSVELLTKHSDSIIEEMLRSDISMSDTVYQSLNPPDYLTVEQMHFQKASAFGDFTKFFDKVTPRPEAIAETAYGTLHRQLVETASHNVLTRKFMLKLADTTVIYYTVANNFLLDDGSLEASLNARGQAKSAMQFQKGIATGGCGIGPYDQVYQSDDLSERLVAIGTTQSGDALFDVDSASHPLYSIAYDVYAEGRNEPVSKEEFVDAQPLLLWKDGLGEYLIFENVEYAPFAECGKPVVYLYPEKEMNVDVRVGAKITKSVPLYRDAWRVRAYHGGRLRTNDGNIVESLYWEGKGHGLYPAVTHGKVVASASIESTLRHDLQDLGLTIKEANDFMEFWLPRMPHTPYIRLTWFGTDAMNILAPLTITPAPDTIIRVFLDFEGVNEPSTDLQPQNLTAKARKGFTVVEWGGLLTE